MQIDVAQLPELVLDNAALLLAHRRRAAVQSISCQHPIDGRGRGYRVAPLAQDGMDLIAVHALLPACNDLCLDARRFAPFPPLWSAAARQQICLIPALEVGVVVLAERLRAGSVVAVEIPNPIEQLRPAALHRLISWYQKPPLLQVIAFNRPVVAVVAHRIVLPWSDPISELVNMHSCERSEAIHSPADALWIASSLRSSQDGER